MIGYVTIGTNDFEKSLYFYTQLFKVIKINLLWKMETMASFGPSREETSFCLTKPYDSKIASPGNGTMIALKVKTKEDVDSMYIRALELGGSDEGKPGPRGPHGFYGGYFRDLDGNKLNTYIPGK